jgi:hypothetical protein
MEQSKRELEESDVELLNKIIAHKYGSKLSTGANAWAVD